MEQQGASVGTAAAQATQVERWHSGSPADGMVPIEEIEIELAAPELRGQDRQVFHDLWLAQGRFSDARNKAMDALAKSVSRIAADIGKNGGVTPALNRHIVDMARFQSGDSDDMICHILSKIYIECGLYGELCAICEEIAGFENEDGQRALGSTVVEDSINRLLARIGNMPDMQDSEIIDRCLEILRRRAGALGLESIMPDKGRTDTLNMASELALDISARRRLVDPATLDGWIRDAYPLSYEFFGPERVRHRLHAQVQEPAHL